MKLLVAVALVFAGCSNAPSQATPEPPAAAAPAAEPTAAPVAAAPAAAPVAMAVDDGTVPADFPSACQAYAQLIERLKACDKIGGGRDGLMRGFEELRTTWPSVAAAQRAAFEAQCKTQADSLRDAVAATCGW